MRRTLPLLVLLAACDTTTEPTELVLGGFTVTQDDDASLTVVGEDGAHLERVRIAWGATTQTIEMNVGAFRFDGVQQAISDLTLGERGGDDANPSWPLLDPDGAVGSLTLKVVDGDLVASVTTDNSAIDKSARTDAIAPLVRLSAACDKDEAFLGLGRMALDVNHVGEAFPLWVSEPGIGHYDTDVPGDDWFLKGTRHGSSYPVPFLLRPQQPSGLLIDTLARVEVDLCKSDPTRWSTTAWSDHVEFTLLQGKTPLAVVEKLTNLTGRPPLAPGWAYGPWNDAVRGPDRVNTVAATLREAGAPSSAIWTEDWKGANQTGTGYRLSEEWDIDTTLYPDVAGQDAALQAAGFKWFAYFAPFVGMTARSGEDSSAAGALIQGADGDDVFTGVTFKPTAMIDVFTDAGRAWARQKMEVARDAGFDGWMADYGEWLPTDARMVDGSVGLDVHNDYPRAWQSLNQEVLGGRDAVYFCRSGWLRAAPACPVTWLGDQRTSFDTDDGLPSILPLALGLSASGVPVTTHDIAGYQSVGNDPRDAELQARWTELGAFSPIMRTHHGSFDTDNAQFDSTPETLALWTTYARENARTWPYRYALAKQASDVGTPIVLPISFVFEGEPWDRVDAWMLGRALLVAPVLEKGATSRQVDLPAGVDWYDWWTLSPVSSGVFDAPVDQIPVFVAAGSTVPLFEVIPDTLGEATVEGVTDFADADVSRRVLLVGGGAPSFVEADGTSYTVTGTATASGETTLTTTGADAVEGDVGGVHVTVRGPTPRTYTFQVVR